MFCLCYKALSNLHLMYLSFPGVTATGTEIVMNGQGTGTVTGTETAIRTGSET